MYVILDLLIVIGAAHVVSVCAALWFSHRNPRWLVLATGFAIITVLYAGDLVNFTVARTTNAELKDLWAWSQESVVCVVLLVSALMVAAPSVTDRTARLVVVGLVAFSALLLLPGPIQDSVGNGSAVFVFNAAVCLTALGYVNVQLRTQSRNGVLILLAAAILLELFSQFAELVALVIDVDAGLGQSFRFFAFAALYYGLFVMGLLRPYRYARHAEEFFSTLVASSPAGITLTRAGRILHANQAFLDLMGFDSLAKAREAYIWDFDAEEPQENDRYDFEGDREDRSLPNTVVRRLTSRDGRIVHARVEHADVEMPDGRATLTYFIDFSKTVEAQDELQRIANHDVLTGLPNRALLLDQLNHALHIASRIGDLVAVLFVDLDQFKQVNDTLGHGSGDELLKLVALRLKSVCRKEDMLGRLGGDEFLVIGQNIRTREGAATLAAKLIRALDTPFDLEGHEMYVGGSIGVSIFPDDGEHAGTMIL